MAISAATPPTAARAFRVGTDWEGLRQRDHWPSISGNSTPSHKGTHFPPRFFRTAQGRRPTVFHGEALWSNLYRQYNPLCRVSWLDHWPTVGQCPTGVNSVFLAGGGASRMGASRMGVRSLMWTPLRDVVAGPLRWCCCRSSTSTPTRPSTSTRCLRALGL